MVKKVGKLLNKIKGGTSVRAGGATTAAAGFSDGVLRSGHAMRVIFFYPGEEGTYVDNAEVTLFQNGIIHIKSNQEETTTHLQNCEILWRFETDAEERSNKVRLLKPNRESRVIDPDGDREPPTVDPV
jgi:hypothetical protein